MAFGGCCSMLCRVVLLAVAGPLLLAGTLLSHMGHHLQRNGAADAEYAAAEFAAAAGLQKQAATSATQATEDQAVVAELEGDVARHGETGAAEQAAAGEDAATIGTDEAAAATENVLTLEKPSGAMFGIDVSVDELVIGTISDGLVRDWNLAHGEGEQLRSGDKIVEVNSLTDPQQMLELLQSDGTFAIKFQKKEFLAQAAAASCDHELERLNARKRQVEAEICERWKVASALATTLKQNTTQVELLLQGNSIGDEEHHAALLANDARQEAEMDAMKEQHAALLAAETEHGTEVDAMKAKLIAAHTGLQEIAQRQATVEKTSLTDLQEYIDNLGTMARNCDSRLQSIEESDRAVEGAASARPSSSEDEVRREATVRYEGKAEELESLLLAWEGKCKECVHKYEEAVGLLRRERAAREEDQIVHTDLVKALRAEKEQLQREVTDREEQALREKSKGKMAIDEISRLLQILADHGIPDDSRYKYR